MCAKFGRVLDLARRVQHSTIDHAGQRCHGRRSFCERCDSVQIAGNDARLSQANLTVDQSNLSIDHGIVEGPRDREACIHPTCRRDVASADERCEQSSIECAVRANSRLSIAEVNLSLEFERCSLSLPFPTLDAREPVARHNPRRHHLPERHIGDGKIQAIEDQFALHVLELQ